MNNNRTNKEQIKEKILISKNPSISEIDKKNIETWLIKMRFKISNKIYKQDNKKNNLSINLILISERISKLQEQIKFKQNNEEILEQIKTLEEEKLDYEKNIEIAKTSNLSFDFDLFELYKANQKIKTKNKYLNKINNLDETKLKEKITRISLSLQKTETKHSTITKEIDILLEEIILIDEVFEESKNNLNIEKEEFAFVVKNLNIFYGNKQAIYDVSINIPKNKVISIIGPSGCGKSTFLKTLNRINDEIPNFRSEGEVLLEEHYDIYKLHSITNKNDKLEITDLRTRVGMIFQQPNPFPMSIYKNVIFGPKINGVKNKKLLNDIVEESLKDAALWDEVSNNLNVIGTSLSGGQQQRLCIARAIANKPQILLMDEPTSALDPIASSKIEELILKLKKDYTIIIVTHSMQQAARISDYTAFFYEGKLIEFEKTSKLFSNPTEKRTDDYIRGKFG